MWWDDHVKEGQRPCAQGYHKVQKMDPTCLQALDEIKGYRLLKYLGQRHTYKGNVAITTTGRSG